MNEVWLRTDESEDVAASIRHCIASLTLSQTDLHASKWVLLSLHSALHGACVCHLTTTFRPVGAVTKQNTLEWIKWSDDRRNNPALSPPTTKIANLPELLKRIRKPNSVGDGSNAEGISLSNSEYEWWNRIHSEIRNQFTHFGPMGWSIDLSGVPDLVQLTVRLIRNISAVGWAFRHTDADWKSELLANLASLDERASSFVTPA
jgi:hypothetical protein